MKIVDLRIISDLHIDMVHNLFLFNKVEDIDFGTLPTLSSEDEEDAVEQIEHVINRLQLEREWKERRNRPDQFLELHTICYTTRDQSLNFQKLISERS